MSDIFELLERFRRSGDLVAGSLSEAGDAEFDHVPGQHKWSTRQILAHLADSEVVLAMRFRQMLAEENPRLEAYDQTLWAERLDYKRRDPAKTLETFKHLRTENYELLKHTPEPEFARAGEHAERGRITVLDLLRHNTEHTEKHAAQLRSIHQHFEAAHATQ